MSIRGGLRSIGSFLRRHIHGPRMEISRANVTAAVALLIICFIALMIRLVPMIGFDVLVRAFDPWYNVREVQFILENGFEAWFGWYDWTTWIPFGRNIPRSSYPGIPFTAALMYLLFQGLHIPIDIMTTVVIFPAIMGVFGVIAIFLLGCEVGSKEIGLLAAFFMAVIPAYTQRTIAGFFDNEAIGIFAILLTMFFFIRALRKGSVASAVMGGLSLGYLSASWSVYLYMFQIFAIFALVMVLLRRYSRRLLITYAGVVLIGMLLAICVPRIGPDWPTSTTGLIPLGVFGLLLLIELNQSYRITDISFPSTLGTLASRLRPYMAYIFGAMCALIVVGLGYLFQSGLFLTLTAAGTGQGFLGDLAGKFYTVIDPLIRQNAFLLASVGEHLPAPWATFWYNLSFLVLLMPFGFYIAFRRERETDILLIIFAFTALYFSGSMIRLALLLAPAAAILGAYGLLMAIRPFRPIFWQRSILTRRRRRITPPTSRSFASVAYLFILLLLLASTVTSVDAVNQMGGPEITPGFRNPYTGDIQYGPYTDYLETYAWMQHSTPYGSIFLSWWDYGYWTRTVGDRFTVVDNATSNKTQIAWVGRMFMETDPVEALRICRRFGVDYVFVHFGLGDSAFSGDEGKWQWMIRIAGEVFGDQVPSEDYYWDQNRGYYMEPYIDTMIYNMLWINASDIGAEGRRPRLNSTEDYLPLPSYTTDPGATIFSIFEPVYFSQIQLMKIFKCNYTWLESEMQIGAASAFAIHDSTTVTADLTQVIVEVKNTGSHAFEIESADVEYIDPTSNLSMSNNFPDIYFSTNTGTLRVEPGESTMLAIRVQPFVPAGDQVNVTVYAAGYIPDLTANVTIPVRSSLAWEVTPILSKCWAYDNGTIYVEIENTGDGYVEIDEEGLLEDTEFSIENAILTRGRLLFTGERLGITIDAEYWDVSLTAGETVNVLLHYQSRQPYYGGLNFTIPITVQATPTPPAAPSATNDSTELVGTILANIRLVEFDSAYVTLSSVSVFCFESSSLFIVRRYSP
ncbi:MAG: STT3 domain-containing protein [Candidatus Thorarchaeota archaeon]